MKDNYQLVIIGGGPAGIATAVTAAEQGIENILIIERDNALGGILRQCIHNGFGLHIFNEELTGPEYATRWIAKLNAYPVEVMLATSVLQITNDKELLIVNEHDGLRRIKTTYLVFAMGCRERTRGAIMTPGYRPAGIFTAGTAQKLVNIEGYMPGKQIVIVGSGDIGLIMARRMTLEGATVKMVTEIMPYSTGLARNIAQCLNDFAIPIRFNTAIIKIHGQKRVTGVTIAQVNDKRQPIPATAEDIACDTVLLSVGLIPENELSQQLGIDIDPRTKGPIVNEDLETSLPGVYACGNVVHVHDLVDHVSNEGIWVAKALAAKNVRPLAKPITISHDTAITYVVPQRLRSCDHDTINLAFRVNRVLRNVIIKLVSANHLIYSTRRPILTPGEMVLITIDRKVLAQITTDLKIELEAAQ